MRKSVFIGSSGASSGGAPTGAAGGDLGGTYPNPTAVSLHWTQRNVTGADSPVTVAATDTELNCNATGAITVNLPASTGSGKNYFFVKTDSSTNAVTINRAGSDTIEGSSSVVLSTQYDSLYLTDASTGSWLKISPKTPGSSGNLFFNSSGAFGAVSGSTSDNITDISTAGGLGSSNQIALTRTWTNTGGSGTNTGHTIDTQATFNGTALVNTISHYYGRLQYQNNGGCNHCLGVLSRSTDAGSGGTVTDWQGFYADLVDSGNPTTTITKYTGYYNNANPLNGTGTRTIADIAGFRHDLLSLGAGSGTTVTKEIGYQTQVRASNPSNGTITKSFGLDVGQCSPGNLYLAAVFCGGRTDFLTPMLQNNVTMGTASVAPLTASQLYGFKQNNFLADSSTVFNQTSVLTHSNGGTGTSIVFDGINDNGGNATATKQSVFRAQTKSSGAPNTSTKQIAFEVVAPANSSATITNISGLEIASLTSGTNTNPARAINQLGASDHNVFAGPHDLTESTAPATQLSGNTQFYADSTAHEIKVSTNGATGFGTLVRTQPGAIHLTGQTATKTIYTLCAAAAGACNVAGQYRITWYFNQGGTACGTPGTGGVTFALTWTDNAGAHSAVALPMNDASSIAVFGTKFSAAASNPAGYASGEFNIWSTGASDIQVTNTYSACGVGTLTWELSATAERVA